MVEPHTHAALLAQQQQANGKALEYACAAALLTSLRAQPAAAAALADTSAARTARRRYDELPEETRPKYDLGARAGVRLLARCEPTLQAPAPGTQFIVGIQADAQGVAGDVRDVLVRNERGWTLGLSIKHNNDVAKNPRLARALDFCRQWTGQPCAAAYFAAIQPVFAELEALAAIGTHWSALNLSEAEKARRFYRPVLSALAAQLERLADERPTAPAALLAYFLGRQDFYKLIVAVPARTTTLQAFNFAGTLGQPHGNHSPAVVSPRLTPPTTLQAVAFKPHSDNTLLLTFDQGWAATLRLHNASAHVEPSLKLDVRLTAMPPALGKWQERW